MRGAKAASRNRGGHCRGFCLPVRWHGDCRRFAHEGHDRALIVLPVRGALDAGTRRPGTRTQAAPTHRGVDPLSAVRPGRRLGRLLPRRHGSAPTPGRYSFPRRCLQRCRRRALSPRHRSSSLRIARAAERTETGEWLSFAGARYSGCGCRRSRSGAGRRRDEFSLFTIVDSRPVGDGWRTPRSSFTSASRSGAYDARLRERRDREVSHDPAFVSSVRRVLVERRAVFRRADGDAAYYVDGELAIRWNAVGSRGRCRLSCRAESRTDSRTASRAGHALLSRSTCPSRPRVCPAPSVLARTALAPTNSVLGLRNAVLHAQLRLPSRRGTARGVSLAAQPASAGELCGEYWCATARAAPACTACPILPM